MQWILNALHGVQDASNSSTSAPTASREHVLPEVKKLNDSVYELCKPSGSRARRPSVEIVFFHGLQFDRSVTTFLTTWLSKDVRESWLPWIFEYFPDARILLISYNGCIKKKNKGGDPDMYITSENLWQDMIDARIGQDGCPVVLVGHSLGGLVMKEVLLNANSVLCLDPSKQVKEKLGFLLQNVKQLFYYSCPHNGTRLAAMETKFVKRQLFKHLTILKKEAARCNEAFRKLRFKYKWSAFSIAEALPTELGQLGRHIVVEEASARYDTDGYYTAQDADHINICRPESRTDARFSKLKNVINQALAADVEGHKLWVSRDEVVGLDKQVEMVRDKLEKSRQVGLFGPGGIGKTTLAKLVYNDMSDNFEYTCFVSEVKGRVTKKASVEDLQAEILKNLYCKGRQVNYEWSTLKGTRVLIGLDDVEDDSQILSLTESGFSPESCVLLTSRDARILRWNDFEVHDLEFLDAEASRRLFCNHAFKSANAPEAYKERVERFTQKCRGWPLILKIAGKYLYKQEERVWDDAFDKLSQANPLNANIGKDEFWPIFKVIYGSLDTTEQQMFLDIAMCFHSEELKSVQRAWRVYMAHSDAGWQNLLDMGLVTKTSRAQIKIQMHEVLRDLGRSIACPDPGNIGGHSRVCYHANSSPWPFEKVMPIPKINLGVPKILKIGFVGKLGDTNLNVLDVHNSMQGNSRVEVLKIVSSRERHYGTEDPRWTIIDTGKLCGLENLKALWLNGVSLHGAWNLLPAKLEFLQVKAGRIHHLGCFRQRRGLENFGENLESPWLDGVVLRWAWNVLLAKLEFLKVKAGRIHQLGCCRRPVKYNDGHATLRQVENYSGRYTTHTPHHTTLESLSFGFCRSPDLPHSFKEHRALKYLRIENYQGTALPDTLADLEAFERLRIGDSRLDSFGRFGALKSLTIRGYPAETIPDSLGQLSALESLTLRDCSKLRALPSTLGKLSSLKSLTLHYCYGLSILPASFGELRALESLTILYCYGLRVLPSTLGQLRALECLTLISCLNLRTLPDSLGQLKALRQLVVRWCEELTAFPETLGELNGLQNLTISRCWRLRSLPNGLGKLQALSHLVITECQLLNALPPTLKELPGLQHLELGWYHGSLKPLENLLGKLRPLQHFRLISDHDPRAVQEALGELDAVKHLNIWIGDNACDRVGEEALGSGEYFEILPGGNDCS